MCKKAHRRGPCTTRQRVNKILKVNVLCCMYLCERHLPTKVPEVSRTKETMKPEDWTGPRNED